MLCVGNDELKEELKNTIKCPHCGQQHNVQYGDEILPDGTRQPSKLLAYYKCRDTAYLAGINGKAI